MNEAHVIINGVELTAGQSMTLRVAVTSYLMEMTTNGLGDDKTGKEIARGYSKRCQEIIDLILKNQ